MHLKDERKLIGSLLLVCVECGSTLVICFLTTIAGSLFLPVIYFI